LKTTEKVLFSPIQHDPGPSAAMKTTKKTKRKATKKKLRMKAKEKAKKKVKAKMKAKKTNTSVNSFSFRFPRRELGGDWVGKVLKLSRRMKMAMPKLMILKGSTPFLVFQIQTELF